MTCTLCDSADLTSVGTIARGGHESPRWCCDRCGLIQVHPQPDLTDYYASGEYRKEYKAGASITLKSGSDLTIVQPGSPEYDDALDTMARYQMIALTEATGLRSTHDVLDVGCGEGRCLAQIPGTGARHGLEQDHIAANEAQGRARGVIYSETLETYDTQQRYDVVYAMHVLEHSTDPVHFLRQMGELCKPGGMVYVEVPDAMDPSSPNLDDHWQHVHFYDFTRHTLFAALKRAGLDGVSVAESQWVLRAWGWWHGRPERAYEPHGGIAGSDVVAHLSRYRERHRLRLEAVEASRNLGPDLARIAGEVKPMLAALRATEQIAASRARLYLKESTAVMAAHDSDPLVMAYRQGLAMGLLRASRGWTHLVHLLRKASGQ